MFYSVLRVIARFISLFVFRIRCVGYENVPRDGGVIMAFNHRSNLDPVIAAIASKRHLTFMAKEDLFENPVFGGLITKLGAFPVKRGKGDIGAIKSALKILKTGNAMLMFPEGRRIKDGETAKAKPGVAMIAQRAEVPVIPICISGQYKWMHKITVTFGEPIIFEEYYGKKMEQEEIQSAADKILDSIRALWTE